MAVSNAETGVGIEQKACLFTSNSLMFIVMYLTIIIKFCETQQPSTVGVSSGSYRLASTHASSFASAAPESID